MTLSTAEFTATASVAASSRVDPRTAPFVTGRSRVAVSVVETASGAIVAERDLEAAGLERDALAAATSAGAQAGLGAGRAAAAELSAYLWKR
ncbi:MAG: hypothetical protein M0D55_07675 [Elusimicrobiota bacterium]|nr:MAG: hypothetical protein M0D55_07675 [Elusimicrobiota bacterium]